MSDRKDDAAQAGSSPRVGFVSLGCAKNLVDSEVMLGHLDRTGCTFVRNPEDAEIVVVNTCSFIDAAREESVNTILELAELKKSGGLKKLVVAGCLVQRYADELRQSLPEVDAFVGLDELDRIVDRAGLGEDTGRVASGHPALLSIGASRGAAVAPSAVAGTSPPWGRSTYLYDERSPRRLATPAWTAYIKIAEGCDHTCAFCAIPSFRGSFRSRRLGSILSEAERLARAGVREVNLIAQDSSHFGRDLGLTDGLARLLEGLNEIDGLRWIRLHYLYPNTVTDGLIDRMASLSKVVEYVDIPLQHAHPATLRRMRRGGSADSHRRLLDRFREAMPGGALRSTFIVGFPGETDDEFEALRRFVEETRFDHVGVFQYSHEQSTPAGHLVDDVPAEVKQARFDRLMQTQRSIVDERNAGWLGRETDVLVEGSHPDTDHLLVGRMPTQAMDVDGQVLLNDGGPADPGEFVRVSITEVAGYDLVGTILGRA